MIAEIDTAVPDSADTRVSAAAPTEGRTARNPESYLLSGTSALGAGVIVERGCGFLANVLAARFGGASTFGTYSLAIATANNIGTYAAGGIGSTAIRFSGKYPRASRAYPTLIRVLLIVSLASAAIAAAALWAGAGPIAHLLRKTDLTAVLHWAAFSAAGMILVECCRGFLVGQRRLSGILVLSVAIGAGMIFLLPIASRSGAIPMVAAQGGVTAAAVLICLSLAGPLGFRTPVRVTDPAPLRPMLGEVWLFTLIQLAGLVGMNAAGWWLTSLVARADTSLIQMGFYAVANQLRNMVGLLPGLLSQSSLAVMAETEEAVEQTPNRVLGLCSYVSTFASFALAGFGILIAPLALHWIYGRSFEAAAAATVLSLATAVVHMGNAPAAARLTIVSIKCTGIINTVWAIVVAVLATVFLFNGGSAATGAAVILAAHVLSSALVLAVLRIKSNVPRGVVGLYLASTAGALALSALALTGQRILGSGSSLASCLLFLVCLATLGWLGRQYRWIPSKESISQMLRSLKRRSIRPRTEAGLHG